MQIKNNLTSPVFINKYPKQNITFGLKDIPELPDGWDEAAASNILRKVYEGAKGTPRKDRFVKSKPEIKTPVSEPQAVSVPKKDPVQNTNRSKEIGIGGLILAGLFGLFKLCTHKKVNNVPLEIIPQNTTWNNKLGATTFEALKKNFMEAFIEPLKRGEVPKNGFLVQGPDSKGKRQFFDWMINEVRKQGVEVIDSTDPALGHSTMRSGTRVHKYLMDDATAQFKKDGKYKLFVMRGMEKMGKIDSINRSLKDINHDCAKHNGVILAYDCENTSNFHYSVTRPGRIDRKYAPAPLADEGLDKWKAFLTFIKPKESPVWAAKFYSEAEELFRKQGDDVFKEMAPYLKYNPPYQIPPFHADLKLWQEYIAKTTDMLEPNRQLDELAEAVEYVSAQHLKGRVDKTKYQQIMDTVVESIPVDSRTKMQDHIKACLRIKVNR